MDTVGNRIRNRRKELNITQKQIFEITGISNGNLSIIENDKSWPSSQALISLSKILDCSIDWILTGKGSSKFCTEAETELSEEELSLLHHYRSQNAENQRMIRKFAEFLSSNQGSAL